MSTKSFRIGVLGDSHFGSNFQQLTHLRHFMRRAKREGVERFIHMGDLFEGRMRHQGTEFLRFLHAADDLRDYAVVNYPDTGVPTDIITGNHDLSIAKQVGHNVVSAVADKRDDITFLGDEEAYLTIHGVRFRLFHPGGSAGMSKSLRAQQEVWKNIEPHDVLLMGHFHFFNFTHENGVHGVNVPCFQARTPYERSKNLYPVVGGLILDVSKKDGQVSISVNPVLYPEALPRDWGW
jgi:predicted phosphodiesterase